MPETLDVPSNVIWLKQIDDLWYSFSEPSPELLELFGTNQLPTPFKAQAPAEQVYKVIQERNPDKIVLVIA